MQAVLLLLYKHFFLKLELPRGRSSFSSGSKGMWRIQRSPSGNLWTRRYL